MNALFDAELNALRGVAESHEVGDASLRAASPLERLLEHAEPLNREDEELLLRLVVRREATLILIILRTAEGSNAWKQWVTTPEATSRKTTPPSDPAVIRRAAARDGADGLDRIGLNRAHRAGFLRHIQRVSFTTPQQDDDFRRLDDARRTLVVRNLRLALWATPIPWLSMRESLLFGTLGVIEALDRLEYGRARISTYARSWVKARKTLANRRWTSSMRDSGHHVELRMKVRTVTTELRQDPTEPSVDDLMDRLEGVDRRRVAEVYRSRAQGERLGSLGVGGAMRLLDLETDDPLHNEERRVRLQELWALVQKHLSELPRRDRRIASARLGLVGSKRPTLSALGSTLGLSRERIRQIEKAVFESIRQRVAFEFGDTTQEDPQG